MFEWYHYIVVAIVILALLLGDIADALGLVEKELLRAIRRVKSLKSHVRKETIPAGPPRRRRPRRP